MSAANVRGSSPKSLSVALSSLRASWGRFGLRGVVTPGLAEDLRRHGQTYRRPSRLCYFVKK